MSSLCCCTVRMQHMRWSHYLTLLHRAASYLPRVHCTQRAQTGASLQGAHVRFHAQQLTMPSCLQMLRRECARLVGDVVSDALAGPQACPDDLGHVQHERPHKVLLLVYRPGCTGTRTRVSTC